MIKENQNVSQRLNILLDILTLYGSALAAYFLTRFFYWDSFRFSISTINLTSAIIIPVYCVTYLGFGLYKRQGSLSLFELIEKTVFAHTALSAALFILLVIFDREGQTLALFGLFYGFSLALSLFKRSFISAVNSFLRRRGYNVRTAIVIGNGEAARDYAGVILGDVTYGYRYLGYVADEPSETMPGSYLGNLSNLDYTLEMYEPDELITAVDKSANYAEIIAAAEKNGTKISIIPEAYKFLSRRLYIDQIDGIPLINTRKLPLENNFNAFIKRAIDIFGSAILLIVLSPLLLLTAFLIRIIDKHPPILQQIRIGYLKRPFTIYKFRTMYKSSDSNGWTVTGDARRTKLGKILRKLSIDELPQLINVFIGDMSLIGPRPELPDYVNKFKREIPLYMIKHRVKPGITGLAQIVGYRGDTSIAKRIEYDIKYIENWSLILDIYIVFKTLIVAFNNEKSVKKEPKSVAMDTELPQNPDENSEDDNG